MGQSSKPGMGLLGHQGRSTMQVELSQGCLEVGEQEKKIGFGTMLRQGAASGHRLWGSLFPSIPHVAGCCPGRVLT